VKTVIATVALLSTLPALSQAQEKDTWADNARFFVGTRGSVAVPAGGQGTARIGGLELGVSAKNGVGFGLHVLGMHNPPTFGGIPKTDWAFGAAADVRGYIQTVEPLTLYPTFSLGFLAGTNPADNSNIVMPLVNPGFGARMKFDSVYVAIEIGAASFFIPFVAVSLGYEPEPVRAHRRANPALSESVSHDRQIPVQNARPVPAQFVPTGSAQDGEETADRDPATPASDK
jgi:hypothetical protein